MGPVDRARKNSGVRSPTEAWMSLGTETSRPFRRFLVKYYYSISLFSFHISHFTDVPFYEITIHSHKIVVFLLYIISLDSLHIFFYTIHTINLCIVHYVPIWCYSIVWEELFVYLYTVWMRLECVSFCCSLMQ